MQVGDIIVFAQGWSILIVPIILFGGLVILIALSNRRRKR
jgi:hypothetical protein